MLIKYLHKKRKYNSALFFAGCMICISTFLTAQKNKSDSYRIDSLQKRLQILEQATGYANDTDRVNTVIELGVCIVKSNTDSSITLATKALRLAETIQNLSGAKGWLYGMGKAHNHIGVCYSMKGNFIAGVSEFIETLKVLETIEKSLPVKNTSDILQFRGRVYGNIAGAYRDMGNYLKALEYSFKALKANEQIDYKKGIARNFDNIGSIYLKQADTANARKYFLKALHVNEETGYKTGVAVNLNSLGNLFTKEQQRAKALYYYAKALKLDIEIGNKNFVGVVTGNIGSVLDDQGDSAIGKGNRKFALEKKYPEALKYFYEAMKISEELGAKTNVMLQYSNIGTVYLKTGKFKEAENFFLKGLDLSFKSGDLDARRDFEKDLSQVYDSTGRYALAFEHYKKHIAANDSIQSEQNTKKQTQLEMQYEFDRKQTADSIKNIESQKVETIKHQQEISRQRTFTYAGIAGFLVMIIVAGISFVAFRNKKKANLEIAKQKEMVEEKQKEILDSIHYAKKIQTALITNEKYIEGKLKNLNRRI
ncbi:MAG: tetratricopeptide repeat protein [Bacteroidia bacterium]|nr:tetratricopeptide repeat protein [Bacteroidia bacterium]